MSRFRFAAAAATVAALVALSTGIPAAAWADVPSPAVAAPFNAPLCPGTTGNDPTDAGPGAVVPDLTLVFGERLSQYNAGGVVVLYDHDGENRSDGGYPPLCGVRHVTGVGPVAEWMFCTDLSSDVCGSTGANGELLDDAGNPMAAFSDLGSRNPKLTDDEEKIIAYLVRHGHAFTVPPANAGGASVPSGVARADGTTIERLALQELIWCVSDDPTGWPELDAVCAVLMDATEQARILSLVPDTPVVELDLGTAASEPLAYGETVVITLRTNVFNQPIDLTAAGLVGDFTVLSGPATLGAGTVSVAGTDTTVPITVTLGFRGLGVGTVVFDAATQPVSVDDLGWNQSSGDFSGDGGDCQVFAGFRSVQLDTLADSTSAQFTGLAETGRSDADRGLPLSAVLLASGAALLFVAVRGAARGRHVVR